MRDAWFLRHSQGAALLAKCASHDPEGTWEELRPMLESADARLLLIGLQRSIVDRFPRSTVLGWAAQDVPNRPPTLARLTAPDYSRDDTLAAQVADLYGDNPDVSSALFAELFSGVHS